MTDEEVSGEAMLEQAAEQIESQIAEEGLDEDITSDESDDADESEEVEAEEAEESDAPTTTPADEKRARRGGWRPKDEWKGNAKDWIDADEFNKNGDRIASKLHSKIDHQSEQLTKQQNMIKELIKAQGSMQKKANEKALANLKADRREAIELGDADAVDTLDEQIEDVKQENKAIDANEPKADEPRIDVEVSDWVSENSSWFNPNNPGMYDFAIQQEAAERQNDPNADSGEIMRRVTDAVQGEFPHRFKSSKKAAKSSKPRRSPVEGGKSSVRGSGEVRFSDFPPEVQQMAEYFEKNKIMTKREYLKELKKGAQ